MMWWFYFLNFIFRLFKLFLRNRKINQISVTIGKHKQEIYHNLKRNNTPEKMRYFDAGLVTAVYRLHSVHNMGKKMSFHL